MPQTQFTLIYYYIPEDLDDFNHLNAFVIKKKIEDIKLPDIVNQFPITGSYHFRFRCAVKKSTVWLDLMNPTCPLPRYEQKIVMKVTRVSWDQDGQSIPMQRISSISSLSAVASPSPSSENQSPIKAQQQQSYKPQQASQNLLHDEEFVQESKNNNSNVQQQQLAQQQHQQHQQYQASPQHQTHMMQNGNNMYGAAAAQSKTGNTQTQDLLKLESTTPSTHSQKNKQLGILKPLEGLTFT